MIKRDNEELKKVKNIVPRFFSTDLQEKKNTTKQFGFVVWDFHVIFMINDGKNIFYTQNLI